MPAVVVLPRTAQQVSEIVKLANRAKIPVVPAPAGRPQRRSVPLRGGILVDVKRMNQIHEIDLKPILLGRSDPGTGMLKLNEELEVLRRLFPDTPASYPCSLVGGRIACSGFSLLGSRFGHTRRPGDVLRDGAADRGDHPGRRRWREEDPQVVDGLPPQAPVHGPSGDARHRHRGDAGVGAKAGGGVCRVLRLRRLPQCSSHSARIVTSGIATLAGTVLFDEKKIEYLRRDDEAFIPMPPWWNSIVATASTGRRRRSARHRSC